MSRLSAGLSSAVSARPIPKIAVHGIAGGEAVGVLAARGAPALARALNSARAAFRLRTAPKSGFKFESTLTTEGEFTRLELLSNNKFDAEEGFDWKPVGVAAISAGVLKGLGPLIESVGKVAPTFASHQRFPAPLAQLAHDGIQAGQVAEAGSGLQGNQNSSHRANPSLSSP